MYTKQEASKLRQAFWTVFGQYMQPVLSAEGGKINWVNYRTGVPHLHFKMEAGSGQAAIGIVFAHPDTALQQLYYEQLEQLKTMLREAVQEEWQWELLTEDEQGKIVSRAGISISGVHVLRQEDWPELISFFKPRIIALDEFWSRAKYAFEALM